MGRTLDASLLAAMNGGVFTPYFNVQLMDSDRATVIYETSKVIGFDLEDCKCKVIFHDPDRTIGYYYYRIQRGALIAGTPVLVTSSNYVAMTDRFDNEIHTIEGHLFPSQYYSTAGDVTYQTVIEDVCTQFGFTAAYFDDTAAWLDYQFLPAGRALTLNNAQTFFTMLRQKYLIFAADFDEDTILFYQANIDQIPVYPGGYTTVTAKDVKVPGPGVVKYRQLLSRDENMTTTLSGLATSTIHNLGYIESTDDQPTRTYWHDTLDWILTGIPPNLKYMDFDAIRVTNATGITIPIPMTSFREVFDKKLSPSWQWQARHLAVFSNTSGGALPSTIEAAAPYTPINVSEFTKNLNSSHNNLQAFANAVDEMTCGPAIYDSTEKAVPDDADLFGLVDSDTATHLVRKIRFDDLAAAVAALVGGGTGDVVGPAGATDDDIVTFDTATGKLIQDSGYKISDLAQDDDIREKLTAARTYYVRTDGDDANTGLVDSAGGAFETIQHAIDVACSIDAGIYLITIDVGAGTYVASTIYCYNTLGTSYLLIQGDPTTPSNVVIDGGFEKSVAGTKYVIDGFKLIKSSGTMTTGIRAYGKAIINFKNIEFGSGLDVHVHAYGGGYITASGNYAISAGATYHLAATDLGYIDTHNRTITITNTNAFTYFAYCAMQSEINAYSMTFSGAGSCTGPRFDVQNNSSINVGAGSLTYFPGDAAGVILTGGLYNATAGGATLLAGSTIEGGVVFNDTAADVDFRVETDAAYNAIDVDASNNSIQLMSNASGKLGFYGASPLARAAGLTQTYSTADGTLANLTAATLTDNTGGSADTTLASVPSTYSQTTMRNNFADLAAMVNKNTADHADLAKFVNSLVDQLQALGLIG